ncbi:hypothetical protein ACFYR1_30440 [Streptomyces canus]|uniref:hypothetical protein n=1 Tax=Streptomyces canus TaxID=58343 RepID=UPI00368480BD
MSTFNFNGPVQGQSQVFGDHTTQHNTFHGAFQTASALHLADALVQELGPSAPPEASALRDELARAEQAGEQPDHGRVRAWLTTLAQGLGTGSGALALVEQIRQAVGG